MASSLDSVEKDRRWWHLFQQSDTLAEADNNPSKPDFLPEFPGISEDKYKNDSDCDTT